MKYFAQLYAQLDATTKTSEKIAALVRYLQSAPPEDAAIAVHLLTGNKPKRAVATAKLHEFAARAAGLAPWLFAESYDAVGDLAETIALVVQPSPVAKMDGHEVAGNIANASLAQWLQQIIPDLERLAKLAPATTAGVFPHIPEDALYKAISSHWFNLDYYECLVFNKLITGGFRVGVSAGLVQRALGQVAGLDAKIIATRLAGKWQPTAENYLKLIASEAGEKDISQPYPFFLAHPIAGEVESLGECHHWQAEWKWDGIRCQLVKRAGQVFLWSRGEELITPQFPELAAAAGALSDVVMDGEILVQFENSL
jgi:DNA ligase 1